MKVLHIHIGAPKTATTAIQFFCSENARVLAEKGYCYPIFPFSYPGIAPGHNGRFLLGMLKDENGVRDTAQEEKNFKEGMAIVHELFETYDNIVLSDESIWRGMDSEKKDLWEIMMQDAQKEGYRIHVIVYFRRQDKYFLSHWNQQVKKQRSEELFEDYADRVDRLRLDYYRKLSRMAEIVGKENITVRRFESGRLEGGNIYADFLMTLGLTLTEEYHVSQEVRNTGLYGNTHEIKRLLNAFPEMKQNRTQLFIVETLQKCSDFSKKQYPAEMYSKEEIEAFLEPYQAGNRKIAEEYLHEPGKELFDEPVKDLPKWQKENPYMMDDLIRFTGVMGMSLYQENQRLKKELEELSHEFSSLRFHLRHPLKTVIRKIKGKTSSK